MAAPQRSIIREHEFEEQLDALICNAEEADEFVAAAEEVLSHAPTMGTLVADSPREIWRLPMAPVRDRAVMLYYSFNEQFVIFLYVVAYD